MNSNAYDYEIHLTLHKNNRRAAESLMNEAQLTFPYSISAIDEDELGAHLTFVTFHAENLIEAARRMDHVINVLGVERIRREKIEHIVHDVRFS